jgi:hypothetical protein
MAVFETLAGIRILVLCSSFTTRAVVLKNRNFGSDSSLLSMVRARFGRKSASNRLRHIINRVKTTMLYYRRRAGSFDWPVADVSEERDGDAARARRAVSAAQATARMEPRTTDFERSR